MNFGFGVDTNQVINVLTQMETKIKEMEQITKNLMVNINNFRTNFKGDIGEKAIAYALEVDKVVKKLKEDFITFSQKNKETMIEIKKWSGSYGK